jgi:hypothetical protein
MPLQPGSVGAVPSRWWDLKPNLARPARLCVQEYGMASARALWLLSLLCACVSDDPTRYAGGGDAGVDGVAAGSGIYVAEDGKDTNPGTREQPLRTIGAATGLVATKGLANADVYVCKGVYPEKNLRIVNAMTVRGGFACSTWQQAPGFPKATQVDPNESRIENGDPNQSDATLRILNGKGVVVEGFTIVAAAGTKPSVAVRVEDGADAILRQNVLAGGATNVVATAQPGGFTVLVRGARVSLESNVIRGGVSTSQEGVGSFLLRVEGGGGSRVLNNVFQSNKLTGFFGVAFASIGDSVASPEPIQIVGNAFTARSVTATGEGGVAVRFVHALGTSVVDVSRNVFNVGDAVCDKNCSLVGLQASETALLTARHNFIDLRGARTRDPTLLLTARAIFVNDRGTLDADGNVILLPETSMGSNVALYTDCGTLPNCAMPGPKAVFRHNTAYLAASRSTCPFWLEGKAAVVEDNLFVATKDSTRVFGALRELSGASLQSFLGNAFVGLGTLTFDANAAASPLAMGTLASFEARVGIVGANVAEASVAAVIAEPDPAKWMQPTAMTPFAAFDLTSAVRCGIARTPRATATMVDYLGRPWSSMPSVGAYQWQGTTCTP